MRAPSVVMGLILAQDRPQAQLPEHRRAAFVKAVKESKFPDVFRPSTAGRQLSAAAEFTACTSQKFATSTAPKSLPQKS